MSGYTFRLASTDTLASFCASASRREVGGSTERETCCGVCRDSVAASPVPRGLFSYRCAYDSPAGTASLRTAFANRNPVCADSACVSLDPNETTTERAPSPVNGAFDNFNKALCLQSIVCPFSFSLLPEAFPASRPAHCASANVAPFTLTVCDEPSCTSMTRARADRDTRLRTPNAADVTTVTVSNHHSVMHESGVVFGLEVLFLPSSLPPPRLSRPSANNLLVSSAEVTAIRVKPSSTSYANPGSES